MKNLKWIILAAMLVPMLASAESKVALVCDQPVFDYGEIVQSTSVTNVFTVRNDGDVTFLVKRIYASCGCTKGTIDKRVIEPGETASVTATFNSKGKSGLQKTSIRIISSTASEPSLKLIVKGSVKAGS